MISWQIWDVQDYAGIDCSPLIIIPVKYCWTYKQPGHPQGISPMLNSKACPAATEGPSWALQLESWHHFRSILSPSNHQPWEYGKDPNHEACTPTAWGHISQAGAIPGPPRLHQKINVQWPARRIRKKPCHTSKHLQLNCPKYIVLCSSDIQIQASCPCFQPYFRGIYFFTARKLGTHQKVWGSSACSTESFRTWGRQRWIITQKQ